jgi:LytS/YehU family sensor histidine kinase
MSVLLYMLGVGSFVWYAVTIAFPLLLIAARRIDVERGRMPRVIAIVVLATLAAVSLTIGGQYLVTYTDSRFRPPFAAFVPEGLRQSIVPWIAIMAVVFGIEARRRAVQSRIERERLRAQIAEQQLIALTAQLHPHFLFNTLQSISTLIHRDPEAADEMLGKLSDLLRDVLRHRDQAFVSLGEEIRYARTYLEIAQIRFADRLSFSIDVPPELHSASVPLFILQPLVENALGHGIGGLAEGGSITIRGARNGDRLVLEVSDDGAGVSSSTPLKEGIGLSNTRERLKASYSADQSLSIDSASG